MHPTSSSAQPQPTLSITSSVFSKQFLVVEDDDNMFRFDYSPDFLKWALSPPGWHTDWLCAVRASTTKKMVGFISAIPATIRTKTVATEMVEINFLCVHKKLRLIPLKSGDLQ